MAESHGQNREAEIADAMQSLSRHSSSSSSSSSSWEEIPRQFEEPPEDDDIFEYDKWHCHVDKKDGKWILYADNEGTVLQCDAQNVSLELLNELLYVRIDGRLQAVYISEDGKAKLYEGQTNISSSTQQKEEESAKEKMSACSCQEEKSEEMKFKSLSSDSEYTHFENANATLLDQTSDLNKKTNLTHHEEADVGETLIDNQQKTAPQHTETSRVVKEISSTDPFGVSSKAHDCEQQRRDTDFHSDREDNHDAELPSLDHKADLDKIELIKKDKAVTQIQEPKTVILTTSLDSHYIRNTVTQAPGNTVGPSVTNICIPYKDDKGTDLSLNHQLGSCKTENFLEFDEKDDVSIEIDLQANDRRHEVTVTKTGEVTAPLQEKRFIFASRCGEPQTRTQIPKSPEVPPLTNSYTSDITKKKELGLNKKRQDFGAGTANQTIISTEEPPDEGSLVRISQHMIELLKRGKERIVSEGTSETTLELDNRNNVTMYLADSDYFIKLNEVLYKVKFETDGETFLVPIEEATVISSTADSLGAVAGNISDAYVSDQQDPFMRKTDKHGNVHGRDEKVVKRIQCDENVDVASPNDENEQSRKLTKSADDDVSALTDMFGKMEIENVHDDGMIESSCLTPGNQYTSNDREISTHQDSVESKSLTYDAKDANVEIGETADSETHTSKIGTSSDMHPNATVDSSRTERVHSTADTEIEKGYMTVKIQEKDANAESGARPKQTSLIGKNRGATLSVSNTTKDANASQIQRRPAATFSDAVGYVPRNEYKPDENEVNPRSPKERDLIEEESDLKVTECPVAKEESKQGRGIVSTAVQVKNIKYFKFLQDSKCIIQLAQMYEVSIKSLQTTDCQGFEITGEPHAAHNCAEELKNVIENINSASIKLEDGRKSTSETKDNMSGMKAEVEKKFDVSLEFAQMALKHSNDTDLNSAPSQATSTRLSNDEENGIKKVERPNVVTWRFPGGYRLSLCKESIKQSTAVVHVDFTSWNGKDKQLNLRRLDDGNGGYIIKIRAGLPRCWERNKTEELKQLFERILEKAGEDEHNSLAFSTEEMQNWNLLSFYESLLLEVWKVFKTPERYKPVFIELCNPNPNEYKAANYHCHQLISTVMEKEIGCIKALPLEIRLIEDKLNCTEAEVLVNTTSRELRLDAGAVSHALLKTGGEGLQNDCSTYYPKGIDWGEMAITRGHGLPCKYVFHGALPPYPMHLSEVEKLTAFRKLIDSCLTTASELGCRTIAFPVLGAGNLRYPVDLVAAEMFTCVQKFQHCHKSTTLQLVYFVVYPSDKVALQKFRQIESDLKGVTDAEKKEQAAHAEAREQTKSAEDVVSNVVVEIIGRQPAVKEASEYIKTKWRNLHSEEQHLFAVRLPAGLAQDLCSEQHRTEAKQLKVLGVSVSLMDSEYFIRAPTLQILQQSCSFVNQFSVKEYGQQCDSLHKITVITKINNVSKTEFKVMEKMYRSTLDKYSKNETKIRLNGNCIVIEGKAEYVDSHRTEIQKLVSYIKELETCCIPVDEHKIANIDEILKEIDTGNYNACILTEKCQLRLFSKHAKMLNDLKNEILDKSKSSTIKQISNKSVKQDYQKARPDTGVSGTDTYTRQHTGISPIRIKTSSGELKLYVYEGDLLKSNVVCIVNAANEYLTHNAGVAAAIANEAGPQLTTEVLSLFRRYGKVPVGKTVITTAGNLKYRCIIHAVGPNWRDYMPISPTKLQQCKLAIHSAVRNCLDEMQNHKLKSVAIPAVSSGYQGVPRDICALEYAKAVDQYLKETSRPTVEEIHFVDLNPDTVAQVAQTFHDFFVDMKVVSYDHKYLLTEEKAPANTASLHPGKGTVKSTSRSKTYKHGSHSGGSTSSATAELRQNSEGPSADGAVTAYPFIYQSSLKTFVIHFSSFHELQLYTGNILELKSVETIVVREDLAGTAKGRIAQGMVEMGGPKYVSMKKTAFQTKPNFGEVIMTKGGNSRFQYVLHALIHHRQHFLNDSSKWYSAFRKILDVIFKKAVLLKCHSIAMPVFRIDDKQQSGLSEYAKTVIESYKKFCSANTTQKLTVHLLSNEPSLTTVLQSAFHYVVSNKEPVSGRSVAVYPPTADTLKTSQTPKKEEKTPMKMAEATTKKEQSPKKDQAISENTSAEEKEDCVICLDKMTLPKKLPCGHTFCKDCIGQHMKTKKNCPICGKVFGEITGNQPKGQMNKYRIRNSLPGYERYETIVIEYVFPSGLQGPEHPAPGKYYQGITRTAYLPDNTEGRQVLKLLEVAFKRNLTFTIGQSRTTGHSGVITWNDIHHKTNPKPNTQFGYPDPGYFERVKDELAAKGVTVDDIK